MVNRKLKDSIQGRKNYCTAVLNPLHPPTPTNTPLLCEIYQFGILPSSDRSIEFMNYHTSSRHNYSISTACPFQAIFKKRLAKLVQKKTHDFFFSRRVSRALKIPFQSIQVTPYWKILGPKTTIIATGYTKYQDTSSRIVALAFNFSCSDSIN